MFKPKTQWVRSLLAGGVLSGCTLVTHPPDPEPSCEQALTATATAAGSDLSSNWCAIVTDFRATRANLHSLVVMRDGHALVEAYRSGTDKGLYSLWSTRRAFNSEALHDMRSITKSVIALAYGRLLQRGEVPALDTPLSSLYPGQALLFEGRRQDIKIEDLLTMSAGLSWDEPSPVRRTDKDDQPGLLLRDRMPYVLEREQQAVPGAQFTYSGGLTSVLADVMEKSTGRSLSNLVDAEVFKPLGITHWHWYRDLRGRDIAFAGLRLAPRDLATLGELVRRRGNWAGEQIVPSTWVDAMTEAHIVANPRYGYGYQWWVRSHSINGVPIRVAEAIGYGGQRLYVAPQLALVVVMTAGEYGSAEILGVEDALFTRIAQAAWAADQRASSAK